MKHKKSLFIFRQDLRIHDNSGLRKAIQESEEIIPLFVFDTDILKRFPSDSTVVWFLIDAVRNVEQNLKNVWSYLAVYYGKSIDIITSLIQKEWIDAVYRNESYWYNAVHRDVTLQQRCSKNNIVRHSVSDYLIVPIDQIPARKVFTPFYKLRQKHIIANPIHTHQAPKNIPTAYAKVSHLDDIINHLSYTKNIHRPINEVKKRITHFDFAQYDETRNFPAIDWSSKLSAYTRFGIISIRELYLHAKWLGAEVYTSELARREFRQHIFYNFPESRAIEFQEKRRHIQRDNNTSFFEARKNGMTWYPMIDAGMRQLKAENRMHNRVRMVVASFLTKDLLIDWRWWEKYFADYLIDYDTNVNIGNWQWAASVWADPKPLRIFSPILQSERFDSDCIYIKKWIPELRDFSPKEIHNPLENDLGYAKPIVDHYERSKKAKVLYMNSKGII